jgi:hypothetical protein
MTEPSVLDRAYHFILRTFVETGRAPRSEALAAALGLEAEAGRALLHALMAQDILSWLHPGTDEIAAFAPFHTQPTPYRISVRGEQRWFAQCGFETLAVSWLFPGATVTIDAPCRDCGEPLRLDMQDGRILAADPPEMVAFVDVPFRQWHLRQAES